MPLRNRVTPEGEIVAVPERGTMFGNRGGCFHRSDGNLLERKYVSRQWICCVLQFKSRRRRLMQPGRYTELFFLDEATAMAAGHRPCFECRRVEAVRFSELWNVVAGRNDRAAAPVMDQRLQVERINSQGQKITFEHLFADLPNGAFVRYKGSAGLVCDGLLLPWSFAGYAAAREVADRAIVDVLTPRSIIGVLRAGYRPALHPSAQRGGAVS